MHLQPLLGLKGTLADGTHVPATVFLPPVLLQLSFAAEGPITVLAGDLFLGPSHPLLLMSLQWEGGEGSPLHAHRLLSRASLCVCV